MRGRRARGTTDRFGRRTRAPLIRLCGLLRGTLLVVRAARLVNATAVLLSPLALAPVPELGLVLQFRSVGAAAGAGVALRARRRNADAKTCRITTAWSCLGLALGCVVVLVGALLS